jgi:hypothetical protein
VLSVLETLYTRYTSCSTCSADTAATYAPRNHCHVTQAQEVAFADSFVRAFSLEAAYPEVLAQRRQDKLQKLIVKGKWRVAAALCGGTVDTSSSGQMSNGKCAQ